MMLRSRRRSAPIPEPYPQGDLARLRDDLQRLRLSIDCDLSAAVGAVEESQPLVAAELLEAGQQQVADFSRRALQELSGSFPRRPAPVRRRRSLATTAAVFALSGSLIGAAAAAVVVTLPAASARSAAARPGVAAALPGPLAAFRAALTVNSANPYAVLAAARTLRTALLPLLAEAEHDPAAARTLITLLDEEAQLLATLHPADATLVIQQVQAMLAEVGVLPAQPTAAPQLPVGGSRHQVIPVPGPLELPAPAAHRRPTPAASPDTASSPSPQPSLAPSSQPSPASSPSGGGQVLQPSPSSTTALLSGEIG